MYKRILTPPGLSSYFLFGPRGTGKTSWLKQNFPGALYFDLLEFDNFRTLMNNPQALESMIPVNYTNWIIIDEVQKVPILLDEVQRLIEKCRYRFILTGSSARKLKASGVNLLAGRALTYKMFPLTASELKQDFNFKRSLLYGHLPQAYGLKNPTRFLKSYVETYLKEEIQQESLTRNLPAFSRFLEAASFSQGSPLNVSGVARECGVNRKVVEEYFSILRDTLISFEIPVFTKRAKRDLLSSVKFYFFDAGVYRTIRPQGPLDSASEIDGATLETLILQELLACISYDELDFSLYYWHTRQHVEVDFILYGRRGLIAIEVKRANKFRPEDLKGLKLFKEDYPMARAYLVYCGIKEVHYDGIDIVPAHLFLGQIQSYLIPQTPV